MTIAKHYRLQDPSQEPRAFAFAVHNPTPEPACVELEVGYAGLVAGAAVPAAVGVAAGGSVTLVVLGGWQWLKIAVRMSPISWDLEHY
jgi:hypothetical protein